MRACHVMVFSFMLCGGCSSQPPQENPPTTQVADANPSKTTNQPASPHEKPAVNTTPMTAANPDKVKQTPKPAEKPKGPVSLQDYLAEMERELATETIELERGTRSKKRGCVSLFLGRYSDAMKHFEQCLQENQTDGEARMWMGRCMLWQIKQLVEEGKNLEAEAQLRQYELVIQQSMKVRKLMGWWIGEGSLGKPEPEPTEADVLTWMALHTTDISTRDFAVKKLETPSKVQAERMVVVMWNPYVLDDVRAGKSKKGTCEILLRAVAKHQPAVLTSSRDKATKLKQEFDLFVNMLGVSSGDLSGTIARTREERMYWDTLLQLLRPASE